MKVIGLRQLVLTALKKDNFCFILLGFKPTADELHDWTLLSASLPWLRDPACDRPKLCQDLRRHGLAILACESEAEARRLFTETRCRRLWVDALYIVKDRSSDVESR